MRRLFTWLAATVCLAFAGATIAQDKPAAKADKPAAEAAKPTTAAPAAEAKKEEAKPAPVPVSLSLCCHRCSTTPSWRWS